MNERCSVLTDQDSCESEGANAFSDGVCDWIEEVDCSCQTLDSSFGIGDYGSYCEAWDLHTDAPSYDSCTDDEAELCGAENWCQLAWCYVPEGCPGATESSLYPESYWSYEFCGTPNCYSDPNAEGCPHGCDTSTTTTTTASTTTTQLPDTSTTTTTTATTTTTQLPDTSTTTTTTATTTTTQLPVTEEPTKMETTTEEPKVPFATCSVELPYAVALDNGEGICCEDADCAGTIGYCIDLEADAFGEVCLDYVAPCDDPTQVLEPCEAPCRCAEEDTFMRMDATSPEECKAQALSVDATIFSFKQSSNFCRVWDMCTQYTSAGNGWHTYEIGC